MRLADRAGQPCAAVRGAHAGGRARAGELSGTAQVRTNQLAPFTRTQPRGALDEATVFFRGDAVRIEFSDAAGRRHALVLPAGDATAWLEDAAGHVLPLPMGRWPLRADPPGPAPGRACSPTASRRAKACTPGATRANGAIGCQRHRPRPDPAGSDVAGCGHRIRPWIRRRVRDGRARPQQVRSVQYGPLPDAMFKPPAAAGGPRGSVRPPPRPGHRNSDARPCRQPHACLVFFHFCKEL